MMRFLRGEFFRIGGIGYNDFEDFDVQEAPPPINLGLRATLTQDMRYGASSMFIRAYEPPPARDLILVSDDFTRLPNPPGNGPLAGLWAFPATPANVPQVVTNQVREGVENVDCCAFWGSAVAWEIDVFRPEELVGQYAQIVIQDPLPHGTSGNYVGVILRCGTAAGAGVVARFYLGCVFWNGTVCDSRLFYWNGSAYVLIGVNSVLPWAVGDVLRCEITGDQTPGHPCLITLFHNSTPVMRSQLFGNAFKLKGTGFGGPGIAIKGNDGSFWLDNWAGGELRPPPAHLFHRDNFNRANGPLGQPWGFPFGQPRPQIVSNQVQVTATPVAGAVAYYSETGFNVSDQYAQVKIVNLPTIPATQGCGVVLRAGGGMNIFYAGVIHGSNDYRISAWQIDHYVDKVTGTAVTITAGGILRCECIGSAQPVFNMYFNGALILTYTFVDVDHDVRVGGFPGLALFDPSGSTLRLDDWEGGKL